MQPATPAEKPSKCNLLEVMLLSRHTESLHVTHTVHYSANVALVQLILLQGKNIHKHLHVHVLDKFLDHTMYRYMYTVGSVGHH